MTSRSKLNYLLPASFLLTACSTVLGSYGAETGIIKNLSLSLGNVSPEVVKGVFAALSGFGINVLSAEVHPFLKKFLDRFRSTEIINQDNLKELVELTIFEVIKDELEERHFQYESKNLQKLIKSSDFFKGLLEQTGNDEIKEISDLEILQIFDKNQPVFTADVWFGFLQPFFLQKNLDVPRDYVMAFSKKLESGFFGKIETFGVKRILENDNFRDEVFFNFLKQNFSSQAELLELNTGILQIVISNYTVSQENLEVSKENREVLKRIENLLSTNQPINLEDFPPLMDFLEKVLVNSQTAESQESLLPKFLGSPPKLNDYFTGREEVLENIKAQLEEDGKASLFGLHGLGKTQTVLKFAELNKNNYKHIIFINAAKDLFFTSMARFQRIFGLPVSDDSDDEKKCSAVKEFLDNDAVWSQKNLCFLLIFDNVDNPDQIKSFVPTERQGHILFTSNSKRIKNRASKIEFQKLDKNDAILLIYKRGTERMLAKFEDISADKLPILEKIADELAYLPVLLENAAVTIADNSVRFEKYLEKLQKSPTIVLEKEQSDVDYPPKTARNAFAISFELLTTVATEDSDEILIAEIVKEILFACSILAPDDIPEELLKKYVERMKNRFSDLVRDEDFWEKIRARMTKYDLLEYNFDQETFDMHRFVQFVIWNYLIDT